MKTRRLWVYKNKETVKSNGISLGHLYEIYLDGFRIGYIRHHNGRWYASQWRGKHLSVISSFHSQSKTCLDPETGEFTSYLESLRIIVQHYLFFKEHAKSKQVRTFERHATRLATILDAKGPEGLYEENIQISI